MYWGCPAYRITETAEKHKKRAVTAVTRFVSGDFCVFYGCLNSKKVLISSRTNKNAAAYGCGLTISRRTPPAPSKYESGYLIFCQSRIGQDCVANMAMPHSTAAIPYAA